MKGGGRKKDRTMQRLLGKFIIRVRSLCLKEASILENEKRRSRKKKREKNRKEKGKNEREKKREKEEERWRNVHNVENDTLWQLFVSNPPVDH